MEWLHFSDFHFGDTVSSQAEAIGSLVEFVNQSCTKEIHAILLAGDIAQSGQEDEYRRFETEFLKPLKANPLISGAQIFVVPGNHDVDCDAADPITWNGIGNRNREAYFAENAEGLKARKYRANVFRNYLDFVQKNQLLSPNPLEEVTTYFSGVGGLGVDILATNTSFFCDREEKSDQPIAPCPLTSLRERLRNAERKRPLLILGHHPQNCFLPAQQKPFETFLVDKRAIYIHGHEHNPKYSINADGTLRSLGFGAAHVASLGADSRPPYRNSFAHCCIDERLTLTAYSWDSEVGRWDETTRSQFSSAATFRDSSVTFRIPVFTRGETSSESRSILENIPRRTPLPQTVAILAYPSERIWLKLLTLSSSINQYYRDNQDPPVQSERQPDGKTEIVIEDSDMRDLLICIPGAGHILSAKELESYNTRLDTEGYRSVSVVSLGKISGEARDMYLRLAKRKAIEVLVNKDLALKWQELLSTRQAESLAHCDAGRTAADILIDADQILALIVDTGATSAFRLIAANGDPLPSAHPAVVRLREGNSNFSKMAYHGDIGRKEGDRVPPSFDEQEYLKKCYKENNVMKYAALANVGVRFSDFSLEDVYIEASASEVGSGNADRIDALLDDHLAAYPASEKLKTQIKQQFNSTPDHEQRHESLQARDFCQKFGAVLLTGDPGSGKTCFVKSEILAYSKRAVHVSKETPSNDWHSGHVPVMIQLSQAAAEADLLTQGLLKVASRLFERRGVLFPFEQMEAFLKDGRLALFFDGLDEVVSVEKRAMVVQQINDLVTTGLPLGNRIVVTSRPAAINVVNLLPTLRQLELQGLTETEIRLLASRILSLKLSETSEGVVLDVKEAGGSDSAIVRQLLQDCREKPGVARLAKNPLLLTLLVMVYANSGAPSAKRHRIYEEAIRTLASVRGRQTGHDPVSAQDLRERLGAVALSVYRKESGFLPTRAEVTEVVRTVMTRQRGEATTSLEAERFIQKVAESTGLIALGGDDRNGDAAGIVTFMHHSFMEYFAAVGLSRELERVDIASLVTQPRWVEILTLLAGIIGEGEDIAPVLGRCIGDGGNFGEVDAKLLIFALDCALECEVPSEAAIRLLSASVSKCVQSGPARRDPWVRSEIGQRLSQLIASCGIATFESTLASLILSSDPEVCSAGMSLAGYACAAETVSPAILGALEQSCPRGEEMVQCAICGAAAKIHWIRSPIVLQAIAKCLKRSIPCKLAAFEAIISIPGLAAEHWPSIINGLDETVPSLRRLASRAAVQAGLDGDVAALNDAKKDVVANALQHIYESDLDHDHPKRTVRQDTVEQLLNSGYSRDRLIGIQLIPAADSGDGYAYQKLMCVLADSKDHQEMSAALRAIRSSRDTQVLFKRSDLKQIAALCRTGTSDVRKAAIQLLSHFSSDVNAIRPVLELDLSNVGQSEFAAIFAALGRAQVLQDEIAELIGKEIMRRVQGATKKNKEYVQEMSTLLDAAQHLGKSLRPEVSTALRQLIREYKEQDEVKRAALRAYPAATAPSEHVVHFLTEMFQSPPPTMVEDLVYTPAIFAKHCRQNVDFVIACVESMSSLRDAAIALHQQLSKKRLNSETEMMISALRDGINEVSQIIVTFEEFINPSRSLPARPSA